jgi:hypothetical protein
MVDEGKCIADTSESAIAISEIIECPLNPGHRRGRRREKLDLVVPCSDPPDFIFDWMSNCLIQSSVLKVLAQNKITGFETRAARAAIKKTEVPLDVAELVVTGWGGWPMNDRAFEKLSVVLDVATFDIRRFLIRHISSILQLGMVQTFP